MNNFLKISFLSHTNK